MSFQREYAERCDWMKQQFTDWAFICVTSMLYYEDYDTMNQDTKLVMQQSMAAFARDFYWMLLGVQIMFSFMLTDSDKPIQLCRHCTQAFIVSRPSAVFCSPSARISIMFIRVVAKIKIRMVAQMPESQNIEWKSKWKDEYLEWICGYANAQGGKIYIGCDDKGNIIGISNAHKLLEDIPNKIRDSMGIIVGVNLYEEIGKEYIEIDVPPYPIGISCKGVYYYRSGSTRQILTGPALEAFLMRKRGATWDNLPLPAFSLNYVDDAIIERFKKWAAKKGRIDKSVLDEPKEVLMEKLHLVNGSYLTNAAMLLFAKDPEKWQLGAYVKIGYFETDADLMYQDEIHGSILEQIDKIVELVYLKYMKAKITYESMQRIERYFVPEDALREALLNALCHKQYQSGVPIQISVYEDKLYIANCGCLPENWTLENLMRKHASSPYNPNIAHVFYLAGFIESWGRGIEKICSACKDNGVPQPIYSINPGDIMIEFTASEDRVIRSCKVTDRVTVKVTDNERDLLLLLAEDPGYTMPKLSKKMGISRKTVAQRLKQLKEKGIIERIGSDRKGYWKINN
ncbi:MAG: ATP-binding protein [Lachnoclostridium edouardi]|nr:ATP-binding protein [Lachnoclostridium edouardi]MDO4277350.1 ATP-binding protein [Lachnoclostridium edouardi]